MSKENRDSFYTSVLVSGLTFFFVACFSLASNDAKADGPEPGAPAFTPLDREQDLQEKQRLEEKIAREIQEYHRRRLKYGRSESTDKDSITSSNVGNSGSGSSENSH